MIRLLQVAPVVTEAWPQLGASTTGLLCALMLRGTSHSAFLVLKQKVLPLLPRFLNILFQVDLLMQLVSKFYSYLVAPKALSTYILVCVDHFSRFVVLAPLRNKSAVTVAHPIVSHLICPYTTPRVLLSDNGTEFTNQILADICSHYNIMQTFITAHHPASNGLVERTNRKVLEILWHLAGHLHETWKDWLSQVAASINGSVNSCTGKTPRYIIFGYDKRLSYDVLVKSPFPLYNPGDYFELQLHSFLTMHASVREKLKASREEMTRKQHSLSHETFP